MKQTCLLVLALAFIMPQMFSQEVEPNDSPGTADPISGLSIYGGIAYVGDVDWFVLRGQEGTNPTFVIYHEPYVDFDFEIYNGTHLVGRAIGVNSGDAISCYVPGRCHVKIWSARGAGNYQINIIPGSGGGGGTVIVERDPGRCGATGCEFFVLFALLLALKKYARR